MPARRRLAIAAALAAAARAERTLRQEPLVIRQVDYEP